MGLWAAKLLGKERAVPPDTGAPPKAASTPPGPTTISDDEDEGDSDGELNEEEQAEVARIERECSELERRMKGLSSNQQRALLDSNAVIGGLLSHTIRRSAQIRGKGKRSTSQAEAPKNQKVKATQASVNNDPKYVEDLARGVGHVAAFQRHRSRLRAIQHQVEHGTVSLQPRATPLQTVRTLPPMMSLGRAHRLYLLNCLDRLERQGSRGPRGKSRRPRHHGG